VVQPPAVQEGDLYRYILFWIWRPMPPELGREPFLGEATLLATSPPHFDNPGEGKRALGEENPSSGRIIGIPLPGR
jgi:hypothetical protein